MPKWWGSAKGRKANNSTYHTTLIKIDDQVLLRLCAAGTKERHWQVLHRLLLQEWHRLKGEKARILEQKHPPVVPLKRWHVNLDPDDPLAEPGGRDRRYAQWQGAHGVPEGASVLEKEKRAYTRRKSGEPVIDDAGRILEGKEWRPMTVQEKRKYGWYPNLRERRAQRRAEFEAAQRVQRERREPIMPPEEPRPAPEPEPEPDEEETEADEAEEVEEEDEEEEEEQEVE